MSDILLFRNALRDQLRLRKLLISGLLIALPPGMAAAWRSSWGERFEPAVAYDTLTVMLVFGFTLVILSVIFATGIISQELEEKTIVYLLTRPVPRWRILLAKFLASLVVVVVTCWISALAVALVAFGPGRLVESRLARDVAVLPVGALAYGGLFLFLATFVRRPLIFGLLYALGWESWVPNLGANFQKLSMMSYVRVLAPHPQRRSGDADVASLFRSFSPAEITPTVAWVVLGCVVFAALAGAMVIFSEKEYAPREDAE